MGYCPSATPGFSFVLADEPGDAPDGLPVRPRVLSAEDLFGAERAGTTAELPESGLPGQASASTRGAFEWYCDVYDTQGNAESRAEAEHVSAAHVEFFFLRDPDNEPCDLLIHEPRQQ